MLMAAGLGTRLRPFTEREPKALLPLLGVPMAQFALDQLVEAGVHRIVANVHHHAARARAGLEVLERGGAELLISDESALLLGSGGGIRKALPQLGAGPFFLVNADVLCDVDLSALARRHRLLRERHGVWLTLAVFPQGPAGGRYREIRLDPAGERITGLGQLESERPFFASVAVLEPEAFASLPYGEPSEWVPLVLEPAIAAGKAGAFLTRGLWHDVGSPELWHRTHLALLEGLETGRLPPVLRRRLERSSVRRGSGVWQARGTPHLRDASGPAYWAPLRPDDEAPRALGSSVIAYGNVASGDRGPGIAYDDLWVRLPPV